MKETVETYKWDFDLGDYVLVKREVVEQQEEAGKDSREDTA